MLVDDNPIDNFIHRREIKKNNPEINIIEETSGTEALEYIKTKADPNADLIFLDIKMPGMNGLAFLQEFDKLGKELQSQVKIIMLTNYENPDDIAKTKSWSFVCDYITKPLTKEVMKDIIGKYFI